MYKMGKVVKMFESVYRQCFHVIWLEGLTASCECQGGGASIAVSTRWSIGVAKVCVGV